MKELRFLDAHVHLWDLSHIRYPSLPPPFTNGGHLLDIYRAVEAPKVFTIHGYPVKRDCAVSCGIKGALEGP
jgi:predicted TIM-barrel fold metal-dependent hydrolase